MELQALISTYISTRKTLEQSQLTFVPRLENASERQVTVLAYETADLRIIRFDLSVSGLLEVR
jgi:hypothetical protein